MERHTGDFPVGGVKGMPGAADPLVNPDLDPDEVCARPRREQLEDLAVDRDGVIVVHRAFVAVAQDVSQVPLGREGPPGRGGILWGLVEAFSLLEDEVAVEVAGGFPATVDCPEPPFGHEAVLEGAIDAFGPSPGLGSVTLLRSWTGQ